LVNAAKPLGINLSENDLHALYADSQHALSLGELSTEYQVHREKALASCSISMFGTAT
jgi:hypothetical protein